MKKWIFSTLVGAVVLTTAEAAIQNGASTGANLLEQTSKAFTQIAEKAMPATVYIKVELSQSQQELANPFDMFGDDFFRKFFGQPMNPQMQQQPQFAGGSGFLISSDGYVVTNYHVVKEAVRITVTLNDSREYPATIKGTDPRTDLALLKIEEKELPFLQFGDSDALKIGEWVIAIGNPFGIGATLTVGVVSAKGRQDLGIAAYEDFIQTDAAINPGNSGGPLLNLQGEVVGVNTAIFTRSGGYMGIGLSIPSHMVQNVIDQILDTGCVKRAYLGTVLQPLDNDLAKALDLENQEGVVISEVIKGSPAAKAGLQQGDIILQYNDQQVKTVTKLRNEIAMMTPGSEIHLLILRDTKKINISIELGCLEGEAASAELTQKIGIEVENLSQEIAGRLGLNGLVDGVVITKVKQGSPAALAGLRPGFLITGVAVSWNNQKPVKNISEFEAALKEIGTKKHVILIVRHQNFQRYYTIKIN